LGSRGFLSSLFSSKKEDKMKQLTQVLIRRLEKKGIEPNIAPGFMRNLANTILVNPDMNHLQVNRELHTLGWRDFELDYHTLQLAIACFETDAQESLEDSSYGLTEIDVRPHNARVNGESTPVEYQQR
jgi:hypothetical protein